MLFARCFIVHIIHPSSFLHTGDLISFFSFYHIFFFFVLPMYYMFSYSITVVHPLYFYNSSLNDPRYTSTFTAMYSSSFPHNVSVPMLVGTVPTGDRPLLNDCFYLFNSCRPTGHSQRYHNCTTILNNG